MATFQDRLEALKEKSARLRQNRLEAFKEKTFEIGSRVSARVTFVAKETGSRLSMSAKEASRLSIRASRRFSLGARSKSYMLEDSKHHRENIENSTSTRGSLTKDMLKFEDDPSFENDNVRVPSDIEEKEEDASTSEHKPKTPEPQEKQIPVAAPRKPSFQVVEGNQPSKLRPIKTKPTWDPSKVSASRLHQALLEHHWEEAVWMINQRVDIRKWRGVLGESTLHEACMRRAPSPVIKALIHVGADVNATTALGLTPLHSACMYSPSATVIELLLNSGAIINQRSKKGMTPLIAAAMQGRAVEIIALLLKHGANPMLSDAEGKRAIDYVKGKNEAVELLLENVLPMIALTKRTAEPKLTREVLTKIKGFLY